MFEVPTILAATVAIARDFAIATATTATVTVATVGIVLVRVTALVRVIALALSCDQANSYQRFFEIIQSFLHCSWSDLYFNIHIKSSMVYHRWFTFDGPKNTVV